MGSDKHVSEEKYTGCFKTLPPHPGPKWVKLGKINNSDSQLKCIIRVLVCQSWASATYLFGFYRVSFKSSNDMTKILLK